MILIAFPLNLLSKSYTHYCFSLILFENFNTHISFRLYARK